MPNNLLSYFGYALITLLAFFILQLEMPIGDHEFGMAHSLGLAFFWAVFIFLFLIALCRSLYRIYKKKGKFSWYPIIIFITTALLSTLAFKAEHRKFWTSLRFEGYTDFNQLSKDGHLVLFNNGTFEATITHIDYGSSFVGDYIFKDNILLLKRKDLPEKTEGAIYTKYRLSNNGRKLIPLQKSYPNIIIEKPITK